MKPLKLTAIVSALALASCVTSTDPTTKAVTKSVDPAVLAASINVGKALAPSIQQIIDAAVAKEVAKLNPPAPPATP